MHVLFTPVSPGQEEELNGTEPSFLEWAPPKATEPPELPKNSCAPVPTQHLPLAPSFQFLGSPVLRSGALLVCILEGSEQRPQDKGKVPKVAGAVGHLPPPHRPLRCWSLPCPLASGGWCVLTVWQAGIHREYSGEREPDSGLRQEGDWEALLLIQLGSGDRSLSGTWHFQPSFLATCVTWGNTSQNAELPVVGHGVVVTMGSTDPLRALGGVGMGSI